MPKGIVLADAAYGDCVAFRTGLRRLKLRYAVGIPLATRVELLRTGETMTVYLDLRTDAGVRKP